MPTTKTVLRLVFVVMLSFIFSGCNIFRIFHRNRKSADELVAEGERLLELRQYDRALAKFELAMEKDVYNASARYGHAKAAVRNRNLDLITLMEAITRKENDSYILEGRFADMMQDIYDASTIVIEDIEPIYRGATRGKIKSAHVASDLAVAGVLKTVSLFVIKARRLQKEFGWMWDAFGNIIFGGLPDWDSLKSADKNAILKEAEEAIDIALDAAKDAFPEESKSIEEVINELKNELNKLSS